MTWLTLLGVFLSSTAAISLTLGLAMQLWRVELAMALGLTGAALFVMACGRGESTAIPWVTLFPALAVGFSLLGWWLRGFVQHTGE